MFEQCCYVVVSAHALRADDITIPRNPQVLKTSSTFSAAQVVSSMRHEIEISQFAKLCYCPNSSAFSSHSE